MNPIGPRGVYDEAKRFAEAMTMAYQRAHGVETRIVRIFNTYGPRMRIDDGRVVPNFVGQALRGEPLTVYGDGSQTRSFCFVSDLIDGIYRLLLSDEPEPVNIGNPAEISIREFAEKLNEITGSDGGVLYRSPAHGRPEAAPAGHHQGAPRSGLGAVGAAAERHGADRRLVPAAAGQLAE